MESSVLLSLSASCLKQFWDEQIVDLLQYGFQLDFDRNCYLSHIC